MKIDRNKLLDELKTKTLVNIEMAKRIRSKGIKSLNAKTTSESWSALECIEHLNMFGRFYIPEMKNRIDSAPHSDRSIFVSGRLGNYFAKSMIPTSKMKPIKALASMNPLGSKLDEAVIDEFLTHQQQIIEILDSAREIDLTKTKTSISISKLIRLKLGDTMRIVIYHNERHILQAQKALS